MLAQKGTASPSLGGVQARLPQESRPQTCSNAPSLAQTPSHQKTPATTPSAVGKLDLRPSPRLRSVRHVRKSDGGDVRYSRRPLRSSHRVWDSVPRLRLSMVGVAFGQPQVAEYCPTECVHVPPTVGEIERCPVRHHAARSRCRPARRSRAHRETHSARLTRGASRCSRDLHHDSRHAVTVRRARPWHSVRDFVARVL